MVVGEAPGAQEDEDGVPFSGKAGVKLKAMLLTAGINLNTVYMTNALKCRTIDGVKPKPAEIKACARYLEQEILAVYPRFILAVGDIALAALTGRSGVLRKRGEVHRLSLPTDKKDQERTELPDELVSRIKVFPVFSTAYVLRKPDAEPVLARDLAYFGRMVTGNLRLPDDFRHSVIDTPHALAGLLSTFRGARIIAYDIENSDNRSREEQEHSKNKPPRPHQGKLTCIGIGVPGKPIAVIPFEHKDGPDTPGWRKLVTSVLNLILGPVKTRAAYNAPYDDRWMGSRGIKHRATYDPLLSVYLLDENEPHSLKYQSRKRYQAPDYESEVQFTDDYPLKDLALYCALDVYYTLRLVPDTQTELTRQPGLHRVYQHIMVPAADLLKSMEQRGMWMREDVMDQTERELRVAIKKLEFKLQALSPIKEITTTTAKGKVTSKPINWNSSDQKAQVFFGEAGLGLDSIKQTGTGKDSTDKGTLKTLAPDSELAATLLKYNELRDLRKFIASWRWYVQHYKTITGKPVIYPLYKLTTTVTGRLAGEDPNPQNVPRDPRNRRVVGAPPGWVFMEIDGSQMELRGAAHVAMERTMIGLLRAGEDLHKHTAAAITEKPVADVTKGERQFGKPANFGLLYGQQAPGFRSYAYLNYGVTWTLEEAARVRSVWFNLYSDIEPWHDWAARHLTKTGQISSFLGRIRRLPGVHSKDNSVRAAAIREGINFQVQSPCSDLLVLAATEVERLGRDDVIVVGLIHDAIHLWVREGSENEVAAVVAQIVEQRVPEIMLPQLFGVNLMVPILSEAKAGASWGDAQEIEIHRTWAQDWSTLPDVVSPLMVDPHPTWQDHLPWNALLRLAGEHHRPLLPHLYYLRKKGTVITRTSGQSPADPLRLGYGHGLSTWRDESEYLSVKKARLAGYEEPMRDLLRQAWVHY